MNSQETASQRRLEHEAAALVRPVDDATVTAPRSQQRITRQQERIRELEEQNRQLAVALAGKPAPPPIDPIRQQLLHEDVLDQDQFRRLMRQRRLPAKYAGEVEDLLHQAWQQPMTLSREWLLKAVIGGEVLEKRARAAERQRLRGQRRIQSRTQQVAS